MTKGGGEIEEEFYLVIGRRRRNYEPVNADPGHGHDGPSPLARDIGSREEDVDEERADDDRSGLISSQRIGKVGLE